MILFTVSVYFLVFYFLARLLEVKLSKHDDAEPPLVRSRTPVIGHLLGLARYGVSYYRYLRERSENPIHTVMLLSQKVYVVNSPALIAQIYRRPKIIDSNPPFLEMIFKRVFDFRAHDLEALSHGSLRQETKSAEHEMLERGAASMSAIFHASMTSAAGRLDSLALESPETIQLQGLFQTILPLAVADGIFGVDNPIAKDATFLDRFWTFDRATKALTMSPLPSLTAPKQVEARRSLVLSFEDILRSYDNKESDESIWSLLRKTGELARHHGRDTEYIARYFFAVYTAFVINTVPTTFWTIAHILAAPELLASVRKEVAAAVTIDSTTSSPSRNGQPGPTKAIIDVATLREQCPMLQATLNEVLRHISSSMSTFMVNEDVFIDEYLLKKGALVQIASTAIHSNDTIWGPNAASFDVSRPLQSKDKQIHPSAWRTFGGGSTLCPGRHLACDQVLVLAAMLLHTFDVDPVEAPLRLPPRDTTDMSSVMKPAGDVGLVLRRRAGVGRLQWSFTD